MALAAQQRYKEAGELVAASQLLSPTADSPLVRLTEEHMKHLNDELEKMSAMDVLRFCKIFFPNLYQSTAFGLTGLVTLDMLSKLREESPVSPPVGTIFLDTLHHFQETLDLVGEVQKRYPQTRLHVFRPQGCETAADFEARNGSELYKTNPDLYDWLVKVEPLQRAYATLGVSAVLTGRRRSQGAARESIPMVEMDEENGIVKINPLVSWTFGQVQEYIHDNRVPFNVLVDRGYKSIGDWHSTSPVSEGENERDGRWKGQEKTECGIHNKKSRYALLLAELASREKSASDHPEQDIARTAEVEVKS